MNDHIEIKIVHLQPMFVASFPAYGPAPEDEAWGHVDQSEWFYIVRFKQKDLWPEYPTNFPNDTLQTEFSERWLESV